MAGTFVKICGITSEEQAVETALSGADAIGLVFAASPRRVEPDAARRIIEALPPFVSSVGVFVDEEPERIGELVDYCGLDFVQLHGQESPDFCRRFAPRAIKAFRIRDERELGLLPAYEPWVRGFLLDAWSEKAMGGTGSTFDWSIARKARTATRKPVILAGGLDPANVREAISQARPWGVDASSGLEVRPGRKDMERVREFLETVRAAG